MTNDMDLANEVAMVDEKKHTILFVDDEPNILNSLKRLFRREPYNTITAGGGDAGLELVRRNDISLVISDYRMPVMNGVEFLSRVKDLSPDTVRIMLTGYADMEGTIGAINNGEVARYITKPWEDEGIKLAVKEALERFELVMENRRLFALTREQNSKLGDLNSNLEKKVIDKTAEIRENFFSFVKIFADLMELYDPYLGGHAKRVAVLSKGLAGYMGLEVEEVCIVEAAALLHSIGLVGVPRSIVEKEDQELSRNERAILRYNPLLTQELLSSIDMLRQVGIIIRSHMEHYDGTGYPDRLRREEILVGSRIIAVCKFYDQLRHAKKKGFSKSTALELVKRRAGTVFDPDMVNRFLEFAAGREEEKLSGKVPLADVKPGMVLAKNLMTVGGKLLLPRDAVLTEALISKVFNFVQIDPLPEDVHIISRA